MGNTTDKGKLYILDENGEYVPLAVNEVYTEEDESRIDYGIEVVSGGWIVLGILKLCGVLDISWAWVMSPVWLPLLSILAMRAVLLAIAVTEGFVEGFKENKK